MPRTSIGIAGCLVVLAIAFLGGCNGESTRSSPGRSTSATARGTTELTVEKQIDTSKSEANGSPESQWGTVKGQITLGGTSFPDPAKVTVNRDEAHCLSRGQIFGEKFVVNPKNRGVANAFVWLDTGNSKTRLPVHPSLKEPKSRKVVIDQPCCKFEPHCLAFQQGQILVGKNSSPVTHNMNWTGGTENPGDNKVIPSGGQIEIDDLKSSTRPIIVKCNMHGWMEAYVRVFNHPYFAVTDSDGAFEFKNAPVGDFRIVVWHEGVGWVTEGRTLGQPLSIKAGGNPEFKAQVNP